MLRYSLTVLAAVAIALPATALAQTAPPVVAPADEIATTDAPSAADPSPARDNADWARRVMAGEPSPEDKADKQAKAERACPGDPDGKPHGEVWGSVGSGGYKAGGAVVTQRVGECSAITVGYEQTHGGNGNTGRRRR